MIDHRFNAAEAILGVLALAGGLWLLWPSAEDLVVDHRSFWKQSLQRAPSTGDGGGDGEGLHSPLTSGAQAGVSVSAKQDLAGRFGRPSGPSLRPGLARIPHTLPEVRPPEAPTELPMNGQRVANDPSGGVRSRGPQAIEPDDRGLPTWLRNAAAAPKGDQRPMVAVVIDDLGMNRRNTAALNRLQAPLTLAFLPYAGKLEAQTRAARKAGHELLLHLPMEPDGQDWPGPDALLLSLDRAEFQRRLDQSFEAFGGFVGINNHMGSRLTRDHGRMAVVMTELRERGLLFLDSKTVASSVAGEEAARLGVPFAQRDIFLDNELEPDYVMSQLGALERLAKRNGAAVAIGHPHDVTIEALERWLPTLEERGLTLVPISTIVAHRRCLEPPILVATAACETGPDAPPIVAGDVDSGRG